jgi:hypothetical protein
MKESSACIVKLAMFLGGRADARAVYARCFRVCDAYARFARGAARRRRYRTHVPRYA